MASCAGRRETSGFSRPRLKKAPVSRSCFREVDPEGGPPRSSGDDRGDFDRPQGQRGHSGRRRRDRRSATSCAISSTNSATGPARRRQWRAKQSNLLQIRDTQVDLLLCDVIMPGGHVRRPGGRRWRKAAASRPRKSSSISGYHEKPRRDNQPHRGHQRQRPSETVYGRRIGLSGPSGALDRENRRLLCRITP